MDVRERHKSVGGAGRRVDNVVVKKKSSVGDLTDVSGWMM
jgi:hypothetical protein